MTSPVAIPLQAEGTGIAALEGHPALADGYRGRDEGDDYNWLDPWNGTPSPTDRGGHGTEELPRAIAHRHRKQHHLCAIRVFCGRTFANKNILPIADGLEPFRLALITGSGATVMRRDHAPRRVGGDDPAELLREGHGRLARAGAGVPRQRQRVLVGRAHRGSSPPARGSPRRHDFGGLEAEIADPGADGEDVDARTAAVTGFLVHGFSRIHR